MITIGNRTSLANITDLTAPTATLNYPLGTELIVYNDTYKAIQRYKYIKSHGALTQYQPYVISISGTVGSEVITAAPATLAAPGILIGIPQVAFTSGYYGFVLIEGDGSVLMTAETYVVGDMLQILNTGTALVVDGTTGSTTFAVTTCGVCKEAGTTAVARKCYLYGKTAVVAAT
jgi:hypothetical protein